MTDKDKEYTATVEVEFEKEDADFVYVIDKKMNPTSLTVDVKYSFATNHEECSTEYSHGTWYCICDPYIPDLPYFPV